MEELKIILDGFNGRKSGHKADLIHALAQCYRDQGKSPSY
jgi:hypothetical protein